MILTGPEIQYRVECEQIHIEPFNEAQLNPNSYNCRMSDEVSVYVPEWLSRTPKDLDDWIQKNSAPPAGQLDCKKENQTYTFKVPDKGLLLHPGTLYLGATIERIHTENFVPQLSGRSSLARLGISVHQTGGFGDVGFDGTFTLEITCIQPVWIYAGMEICQVQFWKTTGDVRLYEGKYLGQKAPTSSRIWQEFKKEGA